MFPVRYYAPYYFALRYFAETGKDVEVYTRSNLALDFNGSTQYATASQTAITGLEAEGAIYGWFRMDTAPSGTTLQNLFRAEMSGSNALVIAKSATTNKLYVEINDRIIEPVVTGLWSAGQWINLLVQWKKSTATLSCYLNATDVSGSATGTWGSETFSGDLGVAGSPAGANLFDGAIGRIGIWDRLLVSSERTLLLKRWPIDAASSGRVAEWACGASNVSLVDSGDTLTLQNTPTVTGGPPQMRKKAMPWVY